MRSASDNGLDSTSFPNSWPTNSTTGRGSMNAADAISVKCINKQNDEKWMSLLAMDLNISKKDHIFGGLNTNRYSFLLNTCTFYLYLSPKRVLKLFGLTSYII
jgi:hypothetical protein